ncbi:YoaK family protein [Hydrogenophaga pseudoflava]|uniref:YoaK family protein n=1 Tax=Hydrogenophaga pseudoflava TaxID=47421 RepID=UPI0027E3CF3E|nr:YoaK family protein [Hydrogenophaga pseudoflava]MDQ7746770.1 YoaK family protein [Hydrogenophaga pseudoflava]
MFAPIRGFTALQRTPQADLKLGTVLAFVAGAANAGGFLAVGQYTSHMTGMLSALADNLVLGQFVLVGAGVVSVLAFVLGAMSTAWIVNWGMRLQLRSAYGLPLLLEAVLLLVFGLFGAVMSLWHTVFLPVTVVLLCYIMGLQNAVITKISQARIRTTHVTGLVTDLGIELGKLLYVNRHPDMQPVRADRERLRVHAQLIFSFLSGGIAGALGFKHLGYVSTLPLALALLLLVLRPLLDDWQRLRAG